MLAELFECRHDYLLLCCLNHQALTLLFIRLLMLMIAALHADSSRFRFQLLSFLSLHQIAGQNIQPFQGCKHMAYLLDQNLLA